jgi:hypothetical protein
MNFQLHSGGKFPDQLSAYCRLKKESATWPLSLELLERRAEEEHDRLNMFSQNYIQHFSFEPSQQSNY